MKTEGDELQESLDSIVLRAEQLLDRPYSIKASLEEVEDLTERCDVIETMDSVLVIFDLAGYSLDEVEVSSTQETIRFELSGASLEQSLPCPVNPSSMTREFRNGILSLKYAKQG